MSTENVLLDLEISKIRPDPNQPRKDFDEESLNAFAENIKAVGVIQPINVRRLDDGDYMIIAGERRWRASKKANKLTIPAIVRSSEISEDNIYGSQVSENLNRENLNPVEQAEVIQLKIDELKGKGVTNPIEVYAAKNGVSISWVSKSLSFLKYAPEIRDIARVGKIRDYGILNKVSKLKGKRRDQALKEIEEGTFVAKAFFAPKKRAKRTKVEGDLENKSKSSLVKEGVTDSMLPEPTPSLLSEYDKDFFIKLVEKTDYKSLMDRHNVEWRLVDLKTMSEYRDSFVKWVNESG